MSTSTTSIEQLAINSIRTLSMDAVQQANSGHPGTAMALAPVTYSLWNNVLNYDPAHPHWVNRDRFVLSCGHVSMLLYSILHLAGVKDVDDAGNPTSEPSISIDDIKNFRQLGSKCAGHPEYSDAPGIETTTGPLGQGIANSVGLAMASKWFAARYNRPGHDLFNYNTFALCSDGDVMEGIGCEAASIAGHLKLSNLCWVYDDNSITIEGDTSLAFSENVPARFEAMGWQTIIVKDANDLGAIESAFETFRKTDDRPTLIVLQSVIAWGAPNKANTHGAHGAPLGEEEIRLTKEFYGWNYDKFEVPQDVHDHFAAGIGARGKEAYQAWHEAFDSYRGEFPELAGDLDLIFERKLPEGWDQEIPVFEADEKGMATRISSGKVLNGISRNLPWLIGGSADLAPSNMTMLNDEDAGHFGPDNYGGRNLHFGIREHSMGAICNGLSLSGLRAYGGTFFVFTDYMRPAMRLASIMHQPVIYVLTHDSIGLGEDGPTHQPVEHLAACRSIPGLNVFRPADANELVEAYRYALTSAKGPCAMVLTRQNLPTMDRTVVAGAEGTQQGGYVLSDCDGSPDVLLLGTGSEIPICMAAQESLHEQGVKARVVSMPCWELFDQQDESYRESVLPTAVTARVAVEAGARQGWDQYIGSYGEFVGMSSFGASAPFTTLYEHFGITPKDVAEAAKRAID